MIQAPGVLDQANRVPCEYLGRYYGDCGIAFIAEDGRITKMEVERDDPFEA